MIDRWAKIKSKIRVNLDLGVDKTKKIWELLDQFPDVFAWHKGEFNNCKIGEHIINMQGFLPCHIALSRLSFWEKVEVKKQIDILMALSKMKPGSSEYACKVTLLVKKYDNWHFYGNYMPLNLQIEQDSFPMALVEDVLM